MYKFCAPFPPPVFKSQPVIECFSSLYLSFQTGGGRTGQQNRREAENEEPIPHLMFKNGVFFIV